MDNKKFPYTELGKQLKSLRGDLSKKAFAKRLGISVHAYYRYEAGERQVPVDILQEAQRFSKEEPTLIRGVPENSQIILDVQDILQSGDPILVPALLANIEAFKRALSREQQIRQVLVENIELKQRVSGLEGRLGVLEQRVKVVSPEKDPEENAA